MLPNGDGLIHKFIMNLMNFENEWRGWEFFENFDGEEKEALKYVFFLIIVNE